MYSRFSSFPKTSRDGLYPRTANPHSEATPVRESGAGPRKESVRFLRTPVIFAALLAACLTYACGDGSMEPTPPDPPRATTIMVNPVTVALDALGATRRLAAVVHDQHGRVMTGVSVAWSSSDPSVAEVDGSGLVTAVGNGAATITAAAGAASASTAVTVEQVVVEVTIAPVSVTFTALGDTARLAAAAFDANGHGVAGAASWSTSDSSVATVDASGLVTAVANGDARIETSVEAVAASSDIQVAQIATRAELRPKQTVLFPRLFSSEQSSPILIDMWDANGHPLPPGWRDYWSAEVLWTSSDERVAQALPSPDSVNAWVFGGNDGTTTITATIGGVVATAKVLVEPIDFGASFAQTAPSGAPVIAGRPGVFRLYQVAHDFAELNRGPRVDVVFTSGGSSRNLGVAELDRPVPKSYYPDSADVSINHRIPGSDVHGSLAFEINLLQTVGSDLLPLQGDLGAMTTHYVVPERRFIVYVRRNVFTAQPINKIVVRPVVQQGSVNRRTISRADSLATARDGFAHEKWNPLFDAMPIPSLRLGKEGPLYVSHDPDRTDKMSLTLDALTEAWLAECRWSWFRKVCPDWYYLGITGLPDWFGQARSGSIGNEPRGFAAISGFHGWTIAHEVGHLVGLDHAPCLAPNPDRAFRPTDASIGVTPGNRFYKFFSFSRWQSVSSTKKDYMSYCRDNGEVPPVWASKYHFEKAYRNLHYAIAQQSSGGHAPSATGQTGRLLVVSGGRYGGSLRLDPAFVVQGRPLLPSSSGPYELTGVDAGGRVAFRHRFDMDWYWDSPTGDGRFHFAVPALPAWSQSLDRIVLTGPEGMVEMGRDTEEPKIWVFDTGMGVLRSVLRGEDALGGLRGGMRSAGPGGSLVVVTSRGIPDDEGWRVSGTALSRGPRTTVVVRRRW